MENIIFHITSRKMCQDPLKGPVWPILESEITAFFRSSRQNIRFWDFHWFWSGKVWIFICHFLRSTSTFHPLTTGSCLKTKICRGIFFIITVFFTGVFTFQNVACKDAGRAAYSQSRLHVTGEYNRQQAGINWQNYRNVARHPVYTQRVSLVLAHVLTKVKNFERIASKSSVYTQQRLAVYMSVASKDAGMQRVKTTVKIPLL